MKNTCNWSEKSLKKNFFKWGTVLYLMIEKKLWMYMNWHKYIGMNTYILFLQFIKTFDV